jgi:hypothetical protein
MFEPKSEVSPIKIQCRPDIMNDMTYTRSQFHLTHNQNVACDWANSHVLRYSGSAKKCIA